MQLLSTRRRVPRIDVVIYFIVTGLSREIYRSRNVCTLCCFLDIDFCSRDWWLYPIATLGVDRPQAFATSVEDFHLAV